jgi:hypothetical protein
VKGPAVKLALNLKPEANPLPGSPVNSPKVEDRASRMAASQAQGAGTKSPAMAELVRWTT